MEPLKDDNSQTKQEPAENGNSMSQQPQQQQSGGHGGGQNFGGGRGRGNRFGGNRRPPPGAQNNGPEPDFRGHKRGVGFGGRGGGQGGPRGGDMSGGRNVDDRLLEKLAQINGPTYELPPLDTSEKKFSGRNRLYIGNLSNDVNEQDIQNLLKTYGETGELFLNKEKNFGFVKFDFHSNAEKAKRELDGHMLKGRPVRIRFAPNGTMVKVKNLTQWVTNELLYQAFSIFGEVERSVIIVDDRGKSTGEGIVEFARKGSATHAIRKCSEVCYFLTSSLRPVIVEPYEALDESDGFPDKSIHRKNPEFLKAREQGPRFASVGSFEHEYGMRWKQLHELHAQKEAALKKELQLEEEKLEAQMEYAKYEQETEMLREQLRAREMDKERQKREWEMKERQAEEARQRAEEQMRRQQEEMETRLLRQEEEMRRRQQENNLFMQAHQLDNMLDQQEQAYEQPDARGMYGANLPPEVNSGVLPPMDPKSFMNSYERNQRFDGRDIPQQGPRGRGMGGAGHWVNEKRMGGGGRDDFNSKRRRF